MYLLLNIIQICFITTIIQVQDATSYVLLAADLEDFRAIAKKFIPAELADQLTHMASQSGTKQRQPTYDYYSSGYSEEYNDKTQTVTTIKQTIRDQHAKPKFKIQEDLSKMNINEVVEKVKERLANEYANKYKETTQNKQLYVYVPKEQKKRQNEEHHDDDTSPYVDRTTRDNKKLFRDTSFYNERTKQYDKVTTPSYDKWYDKETEFKKTNVKVDKDVVNNNKGKDDIFNEMDLTKTKDSYEDYVTPNKENIYASDETTKQKIAPKETRFIKVRNKPENIIDDKIIRSTKRTTPVYDYEDEHEEIHEPEIKAKTESLLYDERDQMAGLDDETKLKGTIIPRRDYFRLITPKYTTMANVAEKYDFNEPIPERDREPEIINPLGNPSVLVNKKVRLL